MRKEKTPKKRRHTELLLGAHDVIHDANKHAKVSTAWMYMNIYIYIIIYIIIYIHINIILYYNILYYTILYYIILYYTILYYITFFLFILYTYTHIQSYTHIQNIYIYMYIQIHTPCIYNKAYQMGFPPAVEAGCPRISSSVAKLNPGWPLQKDDQSLYIWVWVNTYRYIFNGMNIHLPAILGFTRYQGFDS